MNDTTPPLNVHPLLEESRVIATGRPDDAVAAGL
jgi:hypothetical protein